MKTLLNYCLIGASLLFLNSCTKDEPKKHHNCDAELVIDLNVVISSTPLDLNLTLYPDYLNRNYKIELLKFYLSNWALENSDGITTSLEGLHLVNFESDEILNFEVTIDKGTYSNLHFGIGLDSLTNSSDPAEFESSHPLSISQNTYWSWASKYKFFMLEGRIDTVNGFNPNKVFSYHTGFNQLYREVTIPLNNLSIESDVDTLHLELDLDKVIHGDTGTVDLVNESTSHTLDEISEKISDNLVTSFTLKQ